VAARGSAMSSRWGWSASVLLLLALLGLLMFLADRYDRAIDVSVGQRRTLAPQTVEVLKLLGRPVHLQAFYRDVPQERQLLRDLVDRYQEHTGFLTLEFADLDRRPELAEAMGVSANRTVVLTSGDLQVRTRAPGEAQLTGALVRLLAERPPRVLFLTGYGGASAEDASSRGISRFADLARRQNLVVETFSLLGASRIPPEADCVVLAAPEQPLSPREQALLVDHVRRGGSLFALLEPMGAASADSLVEGFGIRLHDGFVVDPSDARQNLTGEGNYRIALAIGGNREHRITRDFTLPTLYPIARALESVQPPPTGATVSRLVQTDPSSWAETTREQLVRGDPEFDAGTDLGGPLALAYAVELDLRRFRYDAPAAGNLSAALAQLQDVGDARDPALADSIRVGDRTFAGDLADTARLVVTGDVDFLNNANLLVRGNGDLGLAMLLWLTEQEDRIALAARPDLSDPVVLTINQTRWLRVLGIGVGPLLPLLLAGFVLWRRTRWV